MTTESPYAKLVADQRDPATGTPPAVLFRLVALLSLAVHHGLMTPDEGVELVNALADNIVSAATVLGGLQAQIAAVDVAKGA